MAAGLGFKTFNTGDVLSAADTNGYLMQGVLVFANATARDAAITSPQEGQFAFTKDNDSLWYYSGSAWVSSGATGDIEGVTAGTGISGGGTSGTVTVTNSMATAIDAKGDLIGGTGADTFARLAVGANDTVLTADSSTATGLKWAAPAAAGGGMTLISTTTLSGASTTISVASNTYIDLVMQLDNIDCSVDANVYIQLNGETGATAYAQVNLGAKGGTADEEYALTSGIRLEVQGYGTTGNNFTNVELYNANSTIRKVVSVNGGGINGSSQSTVINNTVAVASTAVISSIVVKPDGGTFDGGTVRLYGVK
jgi:hypothetical protein